MLLLSSYHDTNLMRRLIEMYGNIKTLKPVTLSRREDMIADRERFRYLLDSLKRGFITAVSFAGKHQISLDPHDIAGLSLWTKSPELFVSLFSASEREYYFGCYRTAEKWRLELQVSVTGLGGSYLEPGIPAPETVLNSLEVLTKESPFPAENIIWRFDPIVVTDDFPPSFWIDRYSSILEDFTRIGVKACIFSFMNSYASAGASGLLSRFRAADIPEPAEFSPPDPHPGSLKSRDGYAHSRHRQIITYISEAAEQAGVTLYCCRDSYDRENQKLSDFPELNNIKRAACTSAERYMDMWGVPVTKAKFSGRTHHCGCTNSRDGGRIDVFCGRCLYCYADRQFPF